jgi:hypothetical protein
MLFHQNTKKVAKFLMFAVGVLVIVSMILMYTPVGRNTRYNQVQNQNSNQNGSDQTNTNQSLEDSGIKIETSPAPIQLQ